MSQQETDPPRPGRGPDPWSAFGYLVAGVGLYGGIGWLLDRWLGTTFLVAIGIFVGMGLSIYLIFKRFGYREPPSGT